MIGEQATIADIAIQHHIGFMAGLLTNLPIGFTGQSGGDKSTQDKDIKNAKLYWKDFKDDQN